MNKKHIIAILIAAILILNPFTLNYLKKQFVISNSDKSVMLPYTYSNNSYAQSFQNSLLLYDGLTLKLIEKDGTTKFDVTISADNYSISTSKDRIFLLDIAKKNVYILDANGKIEAQVTLDYMPKRVVALSNGGFAVHYFTDVYVEGIKVFSKSGKEVNDITYPDVTLTLINGEESGRFFVMGFFKNGDSLENSVYYYDTEGRLQLASQISNVVISRMQSVKNNLIFMDVNSMLISDNIVEEISHFDFNVNLLDFIATEKEIYILTEENDIEVMDYNFQFINELTSREKIRGMVLHQGKILYYTQNSLMYGATPKQFSKDIVKVIDLGEKTAILFKGEIQIID